MGRASIPAWKGQQQEGHARPGPLCFRWAAPNLVSAQLSKRPLTQAGAAKDMVSEKVTPHQAG